MLVFVSIGEHIAGQLEAIQQEERRLAIENNLQIIPSSQYLSSVWSQRKDNYWTSGRRTKLINDTQKIS